MPRLEPESGVVTDAMSPRPHPARHLRAVSIVLAVALLACGNARPQPHAASAPAPTADVRPAPAPVAPWELSSAPAELDCEHHEPHFASYQDALRAGRKAGAGKRWPEAVLAFEVALATRAEDGPALGELSWALLQVGDAARAATVAQRAIAASAAPTLQAASWFNAAQAAQALGNVERARAAYQRSLELRPSDAVQAQLAKLTAAVPRPLPREPLLSSCQRLASPEAACACLRKDVETREAKIISTPSCELAEEGGAWGRVAVLSWQQEDRETAEALGEPAFEVTTEHVLLGKVGASWAALQIVFRSSLLPQAMPQADSLRRIRGYQERAYADGTLLWLQLQSDDVDSVAGTSDWQGSSLVKVCWVPAAGSASSAFCLKPVPVATWKYSAPDVLPGEPGEDSCEFSELATYQFHLASSGDAVLIWTGGPDAEHRAGRYRL